MLVHLRLHVPADLSPRVRALLLSANVATDVAVHAGVSLDPQGDLREADLARESVNDLLDRLEDAGVGERGGIVVTVPEAPPSPRPRGSRTR